MRVAVRQLGTQIKSLPKWGKTEVNGARGGGRVERRTEGQREDGEGREDGKRSREGREQGVRRVERRERGVGRKERRRKGEE